jgi:hypothetical protein
MTGIACTRIEGMAAAFGLIGGAVTRFEACKDVVMGRLPAGLPALYANGLFSGLGKYLSLPNGFYSELHILMLLGFMALGRLRRPEALRHVAPGEIGKAIGPLPGSSHSAPKNRDNIHYRQTRSLAVSSLNMPCTDVAYSPSASAPSFATAAENKKELARA